MTVITENTTYIKIERIVITKNTTQIISSDSIGKEMSDLEEV